MTYESDDYCKLKSQIARLNQVKRYVDLARDFALMNYRGAMRIETAPKSGLYESDPGGAVTTDIPPYLKTEVVKSAIEWCMTQARAAAAEEAKPFDIEKAGAI